MKVTIQPLDNSRTQIAVTPPLQVHISSSQKDGAGNVPSRFTSDTDGLVPAPGPVPDPESLFLTAGGTWAASATPSGFRLIASATPTEPVQSIYFSLTEPLRVIFFSFNPNIVTGHYLRELRFHKETGGWVRMSRFQSGNDPSRLIGYAFGLDGQDIGDGNILIATQWWNNAQYTNTTVSYPASEGRIVGVEMVLNIYASFGPGSENILYGA